jgi:hypothetical protein
MARRRRPRVLAVDRSFECAVTTDPLGSRSVARGPRTCAPFATRGATNNESPCYFRSCARCRDDIPMIGRTRRRGQIAACCRTRE